jgi:N-acetylmuramoyl-L-alanine amidase
MSYVDKMRNVALLASCIVAATALSTVRKQETWPQVAGPENGPLVCIDPGHPSEVSDGTHGKHISEMRAAWLVALDLKSKLLAAGYRVVLTKSSEKQMVTNRRRAEIANHFDAGLMLRLHCDDGNKSGLGTYYPDRAATLQGHHGPSASVLSASKAAAIALHHAVIESLNGAVGNAGLHTDRDSFVGGKQGALTGSVFSDVPVVLVEMAVLGNSHDDAFMASAKGQDKMASALLAGVQAVLAP